MIEVAPLRGLQRRLGKVQLLFFIVTIAIIPVCYTPQIYLAEQRDPEPLFAEVPFPQEAIICCRILESVNCENRYEENLRNVVVNREDWTLSKALLSAEGISLSVPRASSEEAKQKQEKITELMMMLGTGRAFCKVYDIKRSNSEQFSVFLVMDGVADEEAERIAGIIDGTCFLKKPRMHLFNAPWTNAERKALQSSAGPG